MFKLRNAIWVGAFIITYWAATIGIAFAVHEWRDSPDEGSVSAMADVSCNEAIGYWNTVDEHFIPRPQPESIDWDTITGAWNNMVATCTA